ncbi:MAG TPA: putative sulfate/molybdate transporter [Methylomirabilota bacterium]|nr:putative sulfate/molybdate transporter [Methylomirabilota bacterium]
MSGREDILASGGGETPAASASARPKPPLRFDRHELAGAFGDLGTDLPLIAAMILIAELDATGVLLLFGALQILTGLAYRMPLPVQPLKAMAALVITQQLGGATLYGGGLAIGVMMLVLTASGLLGWLARVIPVAVVRGVQFGLGLQLALLAGRDFISTGGVPGYALAAVAFALVVLLWGHRRWPAALAVIALGLVYSAIFDIDWSALAGGVGVQLPQARMPAWADVWTGLLVLALPQLPLSLGNSLLATERLAKDLFPDRAPSVRKLGFTYALMNLVSPLFGGVPVCHGSGGMAGHYAFGARTGGSVIIYGGCFIVAGLLFSGSFSHLVRLFPKSILGVLLFFEGLALLRHVRDAGLGRGEWFVTFVVGLMAFTLPNGYLVGLVTGWVLHAVMKRHERLREA